MHFTPIVCATLLGVSSVLAMPLQTVQCTNLDNVQLPVDRSNTTNVFSAPTGKLVKVLIGIGSQNYTCTNGKPTPAGALAVLYDASCLAVSNPQLLEELPRVLVNTSPKTHQYGVNFLQRILNTQVTVGYHWFTVDFATPMFKFNDGTFFVGALETKIPAPSYAAQGASGEAYGAVPWLKLKQNPNIPSNGYTTAYRVATAGGSPPPTCSGSGIFRVSYATQYWFYR